MTDYQQSQFKMILETLDFLKDSFNFKETAKNATQTIMEKHYRTGVFFVFFLRIKKLSYICTQLIRKNLEL